MVIRKVTRLMLAAALLVGAAAGQEGQAPTGTFKPFRFKSIDGTTVALSDILGKATLVVFFFPTCQYCNMALPEIQKLHDTYKASGLAVVLINVLPEQDRLLRKFRSEHGYTVPILLGGLAAQRDYSLTTTPTHYLLNSAGEVLSRSGGFTRGDERDLERRIQEALGGAPAPARPARLRISQGVGALQLDGIRFATSSPKGRRRFSKAIPCCGSPKPNGARNVRELDRAVSLSPHTPQHESSK